MLDWNSVSIQERIKEAQGNIDRIKDNATKTNLNILLSLASNKESNISVLCCSDLAKRIIELEKSSENREIPKSEPKIIAVDLDGTLCEDRWPNIGVAKNDVIDYLKKRKEAGDKLILWTCRVGDELRRAIDWCTVYGLEFDAINRNLDEMVKKFGSDPRKIYADEYIDDRNCQEFIFKEV